LRFGPPAGRNRGRIGDHDDAVAVDRQHRVFLRCEQGVEVEPAAHAGQHR
jgi:hypothetical protein